MGLEGFDNIFDIAVHGGGDIAAVVVDTVIGDAVLREVVGADFFAAVPCSDEGFAGVRSVGAVLGNLTLEEAATENRHGLDTVLLLGTLILHGNHDTGRKVGDADGGVGGVDTLAAMATGAIDIDAKILGVNLEIVFLGLWEDGNSGGTSVDAALALCYRDALDTVDAAFKLEFAIWLVARYAENDLFVATGIIDGLGLELHS